VSGNLLAIHEARVRRFDPATGVATVVMPGPYGMEPIEAAPFVRSQIDAAKIPELVVGERVLVTMNENEPPEWITVNADWLAQADDRYVNIPGDTMTGRLAIAPSGSISELIKLSKYDATTWAYTAFYDETDTRRGYVGISPGNYAYLTADTGGVNIIGGNGNVQLHPTTEVQIYRDGGGGPHVGWYEGTTRLGYIQHIAGSYGLWNVQDGYMRLQTPATQPILFMPGGVEQFRFTAGANPPLVGGKTAPSTSTTGIELYGEYGLRVVTNTAVMACLDVRFLTGATTLAASFAYNGTGIGSISRVAANNGMSFNETSDEDVKENIVEIDDELAEWVASIVEPVLFNRKDSPDVLEIGYIAQRVAAAWPMSIDIGFVTPGSGDVANRHWNEDGHEETTPEEWTAWGMDKSKFMPVLHAAWQSTARKLRALTTRVEALELGTSPGNDT